MSDTKQPTLAELNAHRFAALLPETHALPEVKQAKRKEPAPVSQEQTPPKPPTKAELKAAAAAAAQAEADALAAQAPQYSVEQLAVLTAAGIADPATADPAVVAALLGTS